MLCNAYIYVERKREGGREGGSLVEKLEGGYKEIMFDQVKIWSWKFCYNSVWCYTACAVLLRYNCCRHHQEEF